MIAKTHNGYFLMSFGQVNVFCSDKHPYYLLANKPINVVKSFIC